MSPRGHRAEAAGAGPAGGIDVLHASRGTAPLRLRRVEPGDGEQLARVLELHQEEVAAVVVEPLVQEAAGVTVHPPGYLRLARELCDRHGAFLICDETATAFGRTGTMLACEQERVAPDLLCLGRGLTGGHLPLAATLATERIHDGLAGDLHDRRAPLDGAAPTGDHLACAAALASLEAFREEATLLRLQPKIRMLGELLEPIASMPEVAQVRGRGFVAGIDLGEHGAELRVGDRVATGARDRGAIVRALGDVVVLAPPLTIGKPDLRRLVEAVGDSIRAAYREAYGEDRRGGRGLPVEAIPATARGATPARDEVRPAA